MSALPDELWRRIMEIGIEAPNCLSYKELCGLSITCRRLNRLSNEESLWSSLLCSDFSQNDCPPSASSSSSSSSNNNRNSSPNSSAKTLYKIRYERDKAQKLAAHRRAVLRIESQIAEHLRKLQEIQLQSKEETEKMKATVAEVSSLRRASQASVALNVWQPEVVRVRHEVIVKQSVVPADFRIHSLEMELKLCQQHISGLNKAYRDEKKRLDAAKEQLESMNYHPLRDYSLSSGKVDECGIKKKNLKRKQVNCQLIPRSRTMVRREGAGNNPSSNKSNSGIRLKDRLKYPNLNSRTTGQRHCWFKNMVEMRIHLQYQGLSYSKALFVL